MADTGVVKSLLQLLENLNDGIDSLEAARILSVDHQVIVGAVKSLQASGNVSLYWLHFSESVSQIADAMYSKILELILNVYSNKKKWFNVKSIFTFCVGKVMYSMLCSALHILWCYGFDQTLYWVQNIQY